MDLTISKLHESFIHKEFSVAEFTKDLLGKIRKMNPHYHMYLTITDDEALEKAQMVDSKIALGGKVPMLTGIPFSAKDIFVIKDVRTTASSRVLENYEGQYTATAVKKLLDAGAILVGKTNNDAWGHGSSTENSDFGPTKNPWNASYVSGGSSGGSAASLAAGLASFSLAEDTGGSIRQPANYCSVVGLKVTYGRVSRYGAIAFASSLDTVGPMTHTVEDCALVLSEIAGKDTHDATSLPSKVPDYLKNLKKPIKGTKIGLPKEYFGSGLDAETKAAIMQAAKKYESLGCEIIELSLPATDDAINTYYIISPSETSSNLARYDGIRYGNDRSFFGSEAKRRMMIGTYALSSGYYDAYYKKAMQVRTLVRKDFEKAFATVDVMLAPVTPTPPFQFGEKVDDPVAMYLGDVYTVPINLAGVPSLALPCGFTKSNLPIGMQLIGPQLSEERLLQIGYAYEQVTEWHKKKPTI